MIRSVHLKNYKSLVDLSVDFMDTKNKPKKMILIYGENGVGKSNFATCFYTLEESMITMSYADVFAKIMEKKDNNQRLKLELENHFKTTKKIIQDCKTIDSKGNMSIEIEFSIKANVGKYMIAYDNNEIVEEHLEYVLNKNKTKFIDINKSSNYINKKMFENLSYYKEICDFVEKYWGKHSFLSIVNHEMYDKSKNYVESRMSKSLIEVIKYLRTICTKVIGGNFSEFGMVGTRHDIIDNLIKGTISIKEERKLNNAEKFVNYFFTKLYADIKKVYYNREIKEDKILYNLVVKKNIYGVIKDVDFEKESTGTMNLLDLIPYFISACEGQIVVIDELDKGIHDLLIDKILDNILDYIKGQLIITTHNTMLIESRIPNKNIYVFKVNRNAEKELLPITEYNNGRIHQNINPRRKYLLGMYGGIPYMSDIDFDELIDKL